MRAGFCLFLMVLFFRCLPDDLLETTFNPFQALEALGASPPRRRRTAAPSLQSRGNDSETAAQSAVLLSGPSSHAFEPAIPATGPAFPPALFDQLVQRVAAEVTRQLQPASSLPAVQEP